MHAHGARRLIPDKALFLSQVTQIAGPLVSGVTQKKDEENFVRRRWLEALKYGSGNDY